MGQNNEHSQNHLSNPRIDQATSAAAAHKEQQRDETTHKQQQQQLLQSTIFFFHVCGQLSLSIQLIKIVSSFWVSDVQ